MKFSIPDDLTKDSPEKLALNKLCEQLITDGQTVHMELVTRYNHLDDVMNSQVELAGFTRKTRSEMEAMQSAKTDKSKAPKWFLSINRLRPNHESVMGEFALARRKLGISGRTPKDRNRAKAIKKRVEYIEDKNLFPDRVLFPAEDEAWSKGTSWIKVGYNSYLGRPEQRFIFQHVSARDVLVDPTAKGPGYFTRQWSIHRMKFNVDDANEKFAVYPAWPSGGVQADTDYYQGYLNADAGTTRNNDCTIYELHLSQMETDYFVANPDNKTIAPITAEQYAEMLRNPKTAPYVFIGGQELRWYNVLYNRTAGVFDVQLDDCGSDALTPLVDIHSENRFWAFGDVEIYENLNDLLDSLMTSVLAHAKKSHRPLVGVAEEAFTTFATEIEEAIENGGAVPGLSQAFYPNALNAGLGQLVTMLLQMMQDSASRHSASMGELPTKQIAKETILALIEQDRTGHGRKDVMVSLCLRQVAARVVEMIKRFDTEPDFIAVSDTRPGDLEYVPINQVWSDSEYMVNIAQMAGLPIPDPTMKPQDIKALNDQIVMLRKRFEQDNQVDAEPVKNGYKMGSKVLTQQEMADAYANYDADQQRQKNPPVSLEEFMRTFNVEGPLDLVRYKINTMDEDIDLNVVYSIDTDVRTDPRFQLERAFVARREGLMPAEDFLSALGYTDAKDMVERASRENQLLALAKELGSNPELLDFVQKAIASVRAKQDPAASGDRGGASGEGAEGGPGPSKTDTGDR